MYKHKRRVFMEKSKRYSQSIADSRFGGWGWSMILWALLSYFFFAGITTDLQNLIPTFFSVTYGLDGNQLLAFVTPASLVGIVGGFVFARLLLKVSTKKISVIALIITGVLFGLLGYCSNPIIYLIDLMAIQFIYAAIQFAAPTLMADWFPHKKGVALGWATIGAPLSSAAFVPIFSALFMALGLRLACVIIGAAVVVYGIATIFWMKDTPQEVGAYPDNMLPETEEKLVKAAGQETITEAKEYTLGMILKNANTWLIGIGFGLLWMVTVGIVSQLVPRMMSVGYTQTEGLMFLTISSIIAMPGSYFWGWLDSKIGTKITSVIYSVCYILALILLIFASSEILIWIGCIFIGLGLGGLLNLIPSMVITAFGKDGFRQANSIVMTIASIIRVLAFFIMSALLTASGGNYTLPYLVFIGIEVVGAIVLLCIRGKKKDKTKAS